MEATESKLVEMGPLDPYNYPNSLKLPQLYVVFSKTGLPVNLDGLDAETAYLRLTGDDPLTVFAADMVVTFSGGYISALDISDGTIGRKAHTPEMGKSLLKLLMAEDFPHVSYDGLEEWFSDFPVRFIP